MLHTNEPANKYMVAMSAYRATNSLDVNVQNQIVLLNALQAGGFEILDDNMTGCFKEEGQAEFSIEESVMVLAHNKIEVGLLARLASEGFNQDCVMQVATQTHTVRFVSFKDGWVNTSKSMGTLQQVDSNQTSKLEGFTRDSIGNYWAVIA